MYSDELMQYIYKYDLPEKKERKERTVKQNPITKILKSFKGKFATIPVDFKHE